MAAALLLLCPGVARAQQMQQPPHIGYIYPAGGQQGATYEVVVGGQFLTGVTNVLFSGGGARASIVDLIRPITGKELNDLRIQADELLARRSVVRQDFRALEDFRSFRKDKTSASTHAVGDGEIAELKKKYAGATWTDADDKALKEIRQKVATGGRRPANPAIAEILVLRVTVAPDAPVGDQEVRLGAPPGLSNPLLFKIGQLPEVARPAIKKVRQELSLKEVQMGLGPQTTGEKQETRVTLPVVINGQLLPGAVDRYRFAARRGQRLVVAANARALIPYLADAVPGWFQATLTLYDAAGQEVAYADDYRFHPDPVVFYEIPADGDYVLAIRDSIYRGREDFVYRLTVGEAPFITSIFPLGGPAHTQTVVTVKGWNLPQTTTTFDARNKAPGIYPLAFPKNTPPANLAPFAVDELPECLEQAHNGQRRTAQAVTLPMIVNGRIDRAGDKDFFQFAGRGGDQIVAEVSARRLNSPLDAVLRLTDATGKQLALNDDYEDKGSGLETHHADSYLRATLPSNATYYVEITDTQHRGGPEYAYRLRISPPQPDFALRVVPASVNIRVGGTVPITVYALRRDGFTNAITLALKDRTPDLRLSGGVIPAGQEQVRLTLTAAPYAAQQEFPVQLEGRASIAGQTVTHTAVPAEDMMQAFAYRHLVPAQELRVSIGGVFKQRANAKILSALPIKIPVGGAARVHLNLPARTPFGQLEMELSDPPPGITLQKFVARPGGSEIVLACDATQAKPGLTGNLIVAVYMQRTTNAPQNKAAQRPRLQVSTLPAIPFELTAPAAP